jgi:hypothetical protein
MGADLKKTILTQNWISLSDEALRPEPAVRNYTQCNLDITGELVYLVLAV